MLSRRALTDDSSAAVDGAMSLTSLGATFDIVHGAKPVSAKAASQQRPGGAAEGQPSSTGWLARRRGAGRQAARAIEWRFDSAVARGARRRLSVGAGMTRRPDLLSFNLTCHCYFTNERGGGTVPGTCTVGRCYYSSVNIYLIYVYAKVLCYGALTSLFLRYKTLTSTVLNSQDS